MYLSCAMRFYFSECAVTLYYVDSSPDNAAEIIACVTDVNSEIAIPLVNDGHNLTTLASLAGLAEICSCHSFRADPNLADQP